MNTICEKILNNVQTNEQLVKITLNVHEFHSIKDTVYEVAGQLEKLRDELENNNEFLPIEQSIFVDSLISACNKLNDYKYIEEL